MKQQGCIKCGKKHNLYYLVKTNGTRAMFMLCPKMKGEGQVFTIWVALVPGLDLPTYLHGTETYDKLKESVRSDGTFSDEEKKIISLWRRAKITIWQMTPQTKELIKSYVKGDPLW